MFFQPWGRASRVDVSKPRQGRQSPFTSGPRIGLCRPSRGLEKRGRARRNPALKRGAIFCRPCPGLGRGFQKLSELFLRAWKLGILGPRLPWYDELIRLGVFGGGSGYAGLGPRATWVARTTRCPGRQAAGGFSKTSQTVNEGATAFGRASKQASCCCAATDNELRPSGNYGCQSIRVSREARRRISSRDREGAGSNTRFYP